MHTGGYFYAFNSTFNPSFLLHSVKISIVITEIQPILSATGNSYEMKFEKPFLSQWLL